VNVKVNVKEGCRLQATGYRVERVESGRWKGFWGREPVPEGFGGRWLAGGRGVAPRMSHPLGQHGRMTNWQERVSRNRSSVPRFCEKNKIPIQEVLPSFK